MRINWTRFFVGGIVASVIAFVTDGFLHERLLHDDWRAVYMALGANPPSPEHAGAGLAYFAVFELGRGFIAMWLYVMMRGCCKPGPKTAVMAGVVAWIAFSLTGPAQFVPLGFLSNALWMKMAVFQLITSIIATVAGAALYKDVS